MYCVMMYLARLILSFIMQDLHQEAQPAALLRNCTNYLDPLQLSNYHCLFKEEY